MEMFLKVVKDNYANFNGRARRKEYWMFYLFFMLLYIVAVIIDVPIIKRKKNKVNIQYSFLLALPLKLA